MRIRALSRSRTDHGFTLLEMMIVTLIMGVVLAIAGPALISLTNGANRGDAMVQEEQQLSTTLSNLGHDIRSAHTLVVPPGSTAKQVVLEVNDPGATVDGAKVCQTSSANPDYTPVPYQLVEWKYSASTDTLSRLLLNCSTSTPISTTWTMGPTASANARIYVLNGSSAVFSYYNQYGSNISTALAGAIAACSTRVGVDLIAGSSLRSTATVEEQQHIALTDQLDILSQPGNGQC